jgi:hypothetical protein
MAYSPPMIAFFLTFGFGILIATLLGASLRSYAANTVESLGTAYTLAQFAFVAALGFLFSLAITHTLHRLSIYLGLELIMLTMFGSIARSISTRRNALRDQRYEIVYKALFPSGRQSSQR